MLWRQDGGFIVGLKIDQILSKNRPTLPQRDNALSNFLIMQLCNRLLMIHYNGEMLHGDIGVIKRTNTFFIHNGV